MGRRGHRRRERRILRVVAGRAPGFRQRNAHGPAYGVEPRRVRAQFCGNCFEVAIPKLVSEIILGIVGSHSSRLVA